MRTLRTWVAGKKKHTHTQGELHPQEKNGPKSGKTRRLVKEGPSVGAAAKRHGISHTKENCILFSASPRHPVQRTKENESFSLVSGNPGWGEFCHQESMEMHKFLHPNDGNEFYYFLAGIFLIFQQLILEVII